MKKHDALYSVELTIDELNRLYAAILYRENDSALARKLEKAMIDAGRTK
jgi:hypothetical protein